MPQSDLEWIDSHHHLWDLSRVDYPWIQSKGEVRFFGQPDPIRKDYLLNNYLADVAGRISRSVHVQVGATAGQELRETAFVDQCSRETGGRIPAAAVVAIDHGQQCIETDIEAHMAFSVTRGARHMIGKSAEENPTLPPFIPDIWLRNWRTLVEHDLSFDLQLTEDQYDMVLSVLRQVPDLRLAICHFASAWDQTAEGFTRWRGWMRQFAGLPNACFKISGFGMFKQKWDEPVYLEWATAALEIFGAERCMLGSNFPVDSLYMSYDELFVAWQKLVAQCTPDEAYQLAGGTAANFYSLSACG